MKHGCFVSGMIKPVFCKNKDYQCPFCIKVFFTGMFECSLTGDSVYEGNEPPEDCPIRPMKVDEITGRAKI